MTHGLDIAFFGSSLVSAYWNGAATYYRGIIRNLAERGHRITFYEPDAFERQQHRDIPDPEWAKVVVYPADESGVARALESARGADLVVKASGVGVFDELLEAAVLDLRRPDGLAIFWDVDAPATLDRMGYDPVEHQNGLFATQLAGGGAALDENELAVAAVFGILSADNVTHPEREGFNRAATLALDEYTRNLPLFHAILPHLAREGQTTDAYVVRTHQWATVTRILASDGVSADDPQLGLSVRAALANQVVASDTATPETRPTAQLPIRCSARLSGDMCGELETLRSPITTSAVPLTIGETSRAMSAAAY
jgi:hypothetical protein